MSDTNGITFQQKLDATRQQALILLEDNALERRHHQANVLLMSRIWVKYLGFVTGMILAFVGLVFVLGKIQENPSELSGKGHAFEVSLRSASPGIILTTLGTILMIATIFANPMIEVNDRAVFVQNLNLSAGASEETKPPLNPIHIADSTAKK